MTPREIERKISLKNQRRTSCYLRLMWLRNHVHVDSKCSKTKCSLCELINLYSELRDLLEIQIAELYKEFKVCNI